MNFGFNEEQELLRSTARKFFENECGSDTVRRLMETPEGISPDLWTKLAELGGLGIAEAGSEAQKKEWLPKIAAGDRRVALAWMEPSAQLGPAGVTLTAVEKGGQYTLSGTKP